MRRAPVRGPDQAVQPAHANAVLRAKPC